MKAFMGRAGPRKIKAVNVVAGSSSNRLPALSHGTLFRRKATCSEQRCLWAFPMACKAQGARRNPRHSLDLVAATVPELACLPAGWF